MPEGPATHTCESVLQCPAASRVFLPALSCDRKANAEYCEEVLWELIESGATASDSLGATSYSDFLADGAKRGALEKGAGALVLSAPISSLKSWFELIARKLNHGEKLLSEELVNVSKTNYFSLDEMRKLFGKHIAGECEQCLRSYNPVTEFVFVRLYLSTGQSGDGTLAWDVVQYEEPAPELVRQSSQFEMCADLHFLQAVKFAAPAAAAIVSPQEAVKVLLESLKLEAYDVTQLKNGSVQKGQEMLLRQHCAACDKKREGANLTCSACNVAMYCERDCQVAHWKAQHKQNCKLLKTIKDQYLSK